VQTRRRKLRLRQQTRKRRLHPRLDCPIQAPKPVSASFTGFRFCRGGQRLENLALQDFDLLLGRFQALLAEARQLQPRLCVASACSSDSSPLSMLWTIFSSSASAARSSARLKACSSFGKILFF